MTLALIINTFEQPEYLARVLCAVSAQTSPPEEVLLADDGSGPATRKVFAEWAACRHGPSWHVWQEHQDFRRARILNQAIAKAQSDYLVFLDGDTIPHSAFVADHRTLAEQAYFVQGHRALVGEKAATSFGHNARTSELAKAWLRGQLGGMKHAFRWPYPLRRERSDLRGIRGCNLGMWRGDLLRVNGYNEQFVGWGREDSELAVRLMNAGVRRLDVRGWAICYHLWHPAASRANLTTNEQLLESVRASAASICEAGLDQYLDRA